MIKVKCTIFDENDNKQFSLGPFPNVVFEKNTVYDGCSDGEAILHFQGGIWTVLQPGNFQGLQIDEFVIHS